MEEPESVESHHVDGYSHFDGLANASHSSQILETNPELDFHIANGDLSPLEEFEALEDDDNNTKKYFAQFQLSEQSGTSSNKRINKGNRRSSRDTANNVDQVRNTTRSQTRKSWGKRGKWTARRRKGKGGVVPMSKK
jgi:hypothetical protein